MRFCTKLRSGPFGKAVPFWSVPREAWCMALAGGQFEDMIYSLLWLIGATTTTPQEWDIGLGCP
eukprot:9928689-Heterocapsa_arctica.AAC.1